MPLHLRIPTPFLADLDVVCPKADDGKLPLNFLNDLEAAYAHARTLSLQQPVISVADLAFLEGELKAWRNSRQRLLQQYLTQLPCDDPLLGQVSLFGTMDYGRLETAHTRTLAWMLGNREHGFGFKLLEALLSHLLKVREMKRRQIRLTHVDPVESELLIDCRPAGADSGRIDVLAKGRWEENGKEVLWVLAIEAKIDAEESEEQLARYDDWIKRQYPQPTEVIRVFLTPDGRLPQTSSAEWQAISFVNLASVFRRVSGLQDKPGYHFLQYYLTGVLGDICGLPVPVSPDCNNPYAAVDYLQAVLGTGKTEDAHGESR